MKYLHRTAGIVTAFCLMIILFITSVEAVVYWTPGYFEKEYTKYNVLDSLPSMTMDDLLHVTDEMMDYLRGGREDLHVTTTMGGEQREFFIEREIAHMQDMPGPWSRPSHPHGCHQSQDGTGPSAFPVHGDRTVLCADYGPWTHHIH